MSTADFAFAVVMFIQQQKKMLKRRHPGFLKSEFFDRHTVLFNCAYYLMIEIKTFF